MIPEKIAVYDINEEVIMGKGPAHLAKQSQKRKANNYSHHSKRALGNTPFCLPKRGNAPRLAIIKIENHLWVVGCAKSNQFRGASVRVIMGTV